MMMTFADMTARFRRCLLFLATCLPIVVPRVTGSVVKDADHYCRIDPNHTMCLFQYDDQVSSRCIDVGDNDLSDQEIQLILDEHNRYRDKVAGGEEPRGNLGPQPTAKYMMELVWDDELAYIARRWVLQCNLGEKDRSRDVERFAVWQNVDVLYGSGEESGGAASRTLGDHIRSWYDEVESFDSAKVGNVNMGDERNLTAYVAFASEAITYVGCGRAIYTADTNRSVVDEADDPVEFRRRADVLVCNYGPVDRGQPQQLYEIGKPGTCPPGTAASHDYDYLCRKFEGPFEMRKRHRPKANAEKRDEDSAARSGVSGSPWHRERSSSPLLLLLLPSTLLLPLRILFM